MSERYNCPNCGAPIGYAPRCQYCGTLLNWIPVTVEFIAQPMNVKKLVARRIVDKEDVRRLGEEYADRCAKESLAMMFAKKVPDVWDLQIIDNPVFEGKDYFATVYVCAKETQNESHA